MDHTAQGHEVIGQQGWESKSKSQDYDHDMPGRVLLEERRKLGIT